MSDISAALQHHICQLLKTYDFEVISKHTSHSFFLRTSASIIVAIKRLSIRQVLAVQVDIREDELKMTAAVNTVTTDQHGIITVNSSPVCMDLNKISYFEVSDPQLFIKIERIIELLKC